MTQAKQDDRPVDAAGLPPDQGELISKMEKIANDLYWRMFRDNVGTYCHPYIEFCGLLNKYVGLCRQAHAQGLDLSLMSEHHGVPLPAAEHDVMYVAEKLRCIFGPTLRSDPRLAKAFCDALLGDEG
jgi:hypothetical protein